MRFLCSFSLTLAGVGRQCAHAPLGAVVIVTKSSDDRATLVPSPSSATQHCGLERVSHPSLGLCYSPAEPTSRAARTSGGCHDKPSHRAGIRATALLWVCNLQRVRHSFSRRETEAESHMGLKFNGFSLQPGPLPQASKGFLNPLHVCFLCKIEMMLINLPHCVTVKVK